MNRNTMFWGLFAGFGAGAATMYFLDPDRGARRRALVRDKIISFNRQLSRAVTVTRRDLANRGHGLLVETKHRLSREQAPDEVLEARVRSKMGRSVTSPHAIHVTCQGGNVSLSGSILTGELQGLLRCVGAVPGVKSVQHTLEERQSLEEISRANDPNQRAVDQDKEKTGDVFHGRTPDAIY